MAVEAAAGVVDGGSGSGGQRRKYAACDNTAPIVPAPVTTPTPSVSDATPTETQTPSTSDGTATHKVRRLRATPRLRLLQMPQF